MNTMSVSLWLDKIGHGFVNAILLAPLPTAVVAILIQAF